MLDVEGNIWDMAPSQGIPVIPTNVGWRRDGAAVMGRGLAMQAAYRFPSLPQVYGKLCKEQRTSLGLALLHLKDRRGVRSTLCMLPTKPLVPSKPWLSWQQPSSLLLVERGLQELVALPDKRCRFLVPLLGCGEGHLREDDVVPMMRATLKEDRFVLVRLPK